MAGIAKIYTQYNYEDPSFAKLFSGLQYLVELENIMFLESDMSSEDYQKEILGSVQIVENEIAKRKFKQQPIHREVDENPRELNFDL